MQLRAYQQNAVDSIFNYFENKNGNPIVSIPTGGGKTVVIAEFIRRTVEEWPSERFMLLSHVKELLEQNANTLKRLAPSLDVGIFSAGLRQKKLGSHVTVAGIQSIYSKAHEVGDISIVIVDECHLIGKHANGMYQKFFHELKKFCPHVKIVGFSATPFRLDSGPLHKGSNALFNDICFNITIKELIEQKYLCELVTAPIKNKINTDRVGKRGGEFIAGELERAIDKDDITRPALDKVDTLCFDRNSLLFFCAGVAHAEHVAEELKRREYTCAVVVGDTPSTERDESIRLFKQKKINAIVSVGVLTTGFDAPNVDAIICLRPTMSPGLWIQMIGRGSRLCEGKKDCLVLDFTKNTNTHGPIDLIEIDGDGELKTCPTDPCIICDYDNKKSATSCKSCGHVFCRPCPKCLADVPRSEKECKDCGFLWQTEERGGNHNKNPSNGNLISKTEDLFRVEHVEEWFFSRHKKEGSPDSLKVTYVIDIFTKYNEWICLEHDGYAGEKAAKWWIEHNANAGTIPETVSEALAQVDGLTMPSVIRVKREGKYWRIL